MRLPPVGLLMLLALVIGCAGPVAGPPVGSEALPTSTPSGSAETGIGPDVDPCTALTAEQVRRLGVDQPDTRPTLDGWPSCAWDRFLEEPIESYSVSVETGPDVAPITGSAERFDIAGYDAIYGVSGTGLTSRASACGIFVAVRSDQALKIVYIYDGTRDDVSKDEACVRARAFAETVIENLERGAG